jgi:hypothetical protein
VTRFTVVWDADLQTAFTNAWIAGDSRTRSTLSAISNWLDAHLAEDPEKKGRPRSDSEARTVNLALTSSSAQIEATYQVFPDDRLVKVNRLVFRIT